MRTAGLQQMYGRKPEGFRKLASRKVPKGVIWMYEDNRMIAEMEDPLFEPPAEWWKNRYNGSGNHPPPPETEEAENCGQSADKAD